MSGRVDPARARRYIGRTTAAAHAQATRRADAAAQARGAHCALCEDFPQIASFHRAAERVSVTLASAFGGGRR